eukprot:c9158_g1_i15.p1 GENE.c9158_g1_i15~~c9158_g1_i15.p1  ORF type:complete len:181 (+),score=39.44 c9158_g1_i15:82-624(+)
MERFSVWIASATTSIQDTRYPFSPNITFTVQQHLPGGESSDANMLSFSRRINQTGQTPLHWAAGNDQIYLVRLLLKRGANPNAQDPFKVTPLHCAANSGSVEICESLMAAGASMKFENYQGKTPLDVAIQKNNSEIVQFFREYLQIRWDHFCLGRHARVGASSPVNIVVMDVMGEIYNRL